MTLQTNTAAQHGPVADASQDGLLENIYKDDGYFIATILDEAGLAEMRQIVNDKFHWAIKQKYPHLYDQFAPLSANLYHTKSDLIDHGNMWRKAMRTFDREMVDRFVSLSWRERLAERLGPFDLLGSEEVGLPDIYMRLVRPNAPTDIGPIHADQWFTDLGNHSYDPDLTLVKVWVPVYSQPHKDGLVGVPGSHRNPVQYESELRDGYIKPVLPEHVKASLNAIRLPADPGQAVSFRYDFLHGGTVNEGSETRVSLEMTLVLKRSVSKRSAAVHTLSAPEPRQDLAADWKGAASEFIKAVRERGNRRPAALQMLEVPSHDAEPEHFWDAAKHGLAQTLVSSGKPARVLMLGSDLGVLAATVAPKMSAESKFTIVESDRKTADCTTRNVTGKNIEKIVSVVQAEFRTALPFLAKSGPYDLIVVDQRAHNIVLDLAACLSADGRMLVDGLLEDSSVVRDSPASDRAARAKLLLDQVSARADLRTTLLPISGGLLVVARD